MWPSAKCQLILFDNGFHFAQEVDGCKVSVKHYWDLRLPSLVAGPSQPSLVLVSNIFYECTLRRLIDLSPFQFCLVTILPFHSNRKESTGEVRRYAVRTSQHFRLVQFRYDTDRRDCIP
jgi:hypothetical protein